MFAIIKNKKEIGRIRSGRQMPPFFLLSYFMIENIIKALGLKGNTSEFLRQDGDGYTMMEKIGYLEELIKGFHGQCQAIYL